MKKTRLVRITKTSEVSLLGSSDQRRINSIRRITKSDPGLANIFAEPVMDVNREVISWYTDLSGSISSFSEVSNSEKHFLEASWKNTCEKFRVLRIDLDAADRIILDNILEIPSLDSLYLVGQGLLVTEWSTLKVGYRPRNRNIGIELDPKLNNAEAVPNVDLIVDSDKLEARTGVEAPAGCQYSRPAELERGNSSYQAKEFREFEEPRVSKADSGFLYSLWFWGPLFSILCVLNWFLMIDACGVFGIQFLNFCR